MGNTFFSCRQFFCALVIALTSTVCMRAATSCRKTLPLAGQAASSGFKCLPTAIPRLSRYVNGSLPAVNHDRHISKK